MYELQNCAAVDEVTLHSMGTAVIRDISLGGTRIRTLGQQLPEGCKLRVSIMSLTNGKSIEIIGCIVWSKEVESETFDCGIRFLEYEGESVEPLRRYVESLAEGTG
ncbi:MAG: PilZ domain-containing protein [Pseudomonadota bacterium]